MADAIKLNENQFQIKRLEDVDKEKTYARIEKDKEDGKSYFVTRFEILTTEEKSISKPDERYYRLPVETEKSILKDNTYKTGFFKISEIDGTTSKLSIVLQLASKQPGGGSN